MQGCFIFALLNPIKNVKPTNCFAINKMRLYRDINTVVRILLEILFRGYIYLWIPKKTSICFAYIIEYLHM